MKPRCGASAGVIAERALALAAQTFEIEARALQALSARQGEGFVKAVQAMMACGGRTVVMGMGKSGHVGRKVAATLASTGTPAFFVHPAEASHGDLGMVTPGDVVLAISNSGESDEIAALLPALRRLSVTLVAMTGRPESTLARHADIVLSSAVDQEACPLNLAPTASTTAMMAAGDALALGLARRRNFRADDFHRMHPGGMLGAGLRPVLEVVRFRVGRNLPCVPMTGTLAQALRASGEGRRSGALMVVDANGRLAGLLTDGDVRRLVNAHGASALDRPLAECMTRQPRTLPADALVRDAVRMVRELRVDELPVVDAEGRPMGLLDVQDLVSLKVVRED